VSELELERAPDAIAGVDITIVVRGEVDMATSPQLREALDAVIDTADGDVVLQCRDLAFLDSSGIGVLVAARNRLGDRGELVLDSPPDNVRRVLEITGVAGHLTLR
jgi:anti-sigma B factor antagonist